MLGKVHSIDFYICTDSINYESLFTINHSAIKKALKKNETVMVVVNNILESARKLLDSSKVSYRVKVNIAGGGAIFSKENLQSEIIFSNECNPHLYSEIKSEQVKNYLKLTTREKELLKLLSKKFKQSEIIVMMRISLNTLKTHRKRMYAKMKFHDRNDLLNWVKEFSEHLE